MTSPFGGISIDDVPEAIARDTYLCALTDVKTYDIKKQPTDEALGKKMTWLTFEVCQEDSEFVGETGQVTITTYTSPGLSMDPDTKAISNNGNDLSKEIQQNIRKAMKFYQGICKQLGYSPDEIASGVDFNDKKKEKFYVSMYADKENNTRITTQTPIRPADEVNEAEYADLI